MNKRRGFTLVELLVVIAIIALLMSILMPALGRVRKQAKLVICQANLKQWGVCFAMYVDDWDGYFMAGYVVPEPAKNAHLDYWMEALRSCYGDVGDIRLCPMATKPGTEVDWTPYGGVLPDSTFAAWGVFPGDWEYAVKGDYGSYGWNGLLANPPEGLGIWGWYRDKNLDPNWRIATAKGAADVPVLLDHQWVDCWPDHRDDAPEFSGQPWGGT
ncbi:MAG: type II secretion system protein, partial [Planctomycetota bacterium]